MTIVDPIFARDQRGQLSLFRPRAPVHSAQIKRSTAISGVMNDNRRGHRNKPFLISAGNCNLMPIVQANYAEGDAASGTVVAAEYSQVLEALLTRLDDGLEAFAKSAQLDAAPASLSPVTELAAELASIAKVVLESTRVIAAEMNRKEVQTRALQFSLDAARRSAEIDFLTGLPNRRAFEAVLKSELASAIARNEPLCVAFVDLDHFKTINDIHGHDAGDRVLKVVAQILADISNDKCHVARHGGEEFVVLFRGRNLSEAWAELDLARQALAGSSLVKRVAGVPFGNITFSGGIADVLAHASPGDALKAADGALYAAKSSGRNRIAWASAQSVHRAAA